MGKESKRGDPAGAAWEGASPRVRLWRGGPPGSGRHVLHWMQAAQRAEDNAALDHAVEMANGVGVPLLVAFALAPGYPGANLRHDHFMLHGLRSVAEALRRRGIGFVLRLGDPPAVMAELSREAVAVTVDGGCTRVQRQWREALAAGVSVPFHEVDSETVVPLLTASDHEEFAARTLRPKMARLLPMWLTAPNPPGEIRHPWRGNLPAGEDLADPDALLSRLPGLDRTVGPVVGIEAGTAAGMRRLRAFVAEGLDGYAERRGDPNVDGTSRLGAYLHFGQVAPLRVAWEVQSSGSPGASVFLEELVVRRELARNFVAFNPDYDRYEGLPAWARKTLAKHARDRREAVYSRDEFAAASTHDPAWNAAQRELSVTGWLHNHLRMYWGKQILAWSRSPEEAFDTALWLNDRFELDGRDANGHAGVAWCFGKHDRPWGERPVFGTVRCMTSGGLARKFDVAAYCRRVMGGKV